MINKILEVLEDKLYDDDIKKLWNEIASENGYEEIYDLTPVNFNEVLGSKNPWDLLQELDDDFDSDNEYFYFDERYGRYVSTNDIYDLVDLGDLADLIEDIFEDNEQDYYDLPEELLDLLDEEEDEE